MPAMFVAGGQAGYVTTASGKNLVVSIYALNGIYPTVSQGLGGDGQDIDSGGVLPNTEKVLAIVQSNN